MSKPNSGLFAGTKGSKEVDEVKEIDQTLNSLLNPRLSEEGNELIQNVQNQGLKISPDKVLNIGKMPNGKIVWIEEGKLTDKPSGLAHIWEKHSKEFSSLGIPKNEVPKFVIDVITKGSKVGIQGNHKEPRDVFEYNHKGKTIYLAVSTSNNGYIVGANFTTKIKKENKQ